MSIVHYKASLVIYQSNIGVLIDSNYIHTTHIPEPYIYVHTSRLGFCGIYIFKPSIHCSLPIPVLEPNLLKITILRIPNTSMRFHLPKMRDEFSFDTTNPWPPVSSGSIIRHWFRHDPYESNLNQLHKNI